MVDKERIERIINLRLEKNLSESEVAKLLGISERQYVRYEKGDTKITTAICIKLADLYNVSCDYLAGLTDIKKPYPPAPKKNK